MQKSSDEIPILVGQSGPLNGYRWYLNDGLVVGRDSTCDIIIPDRQISREHATFTIQPKGIILTDLNSKNGTYLNGSLISSPVVMKDGDVIQIAFAQEFIFISAESTAPLTVDNLTPVGEQRLRLHIEKKSRRVWVGDAEVVPPLSVAQYNMLEMLFEASGRIVGRKDISEGIWGEENALGVSNQALDALIRRLRDRLAAVDMTHSYIITVRGHGLRLDNPPYNP